MPRHFQILAFDSIEEAAAESTTRAAIRWLFSNGYISEAMSNNYSEDGLAYGAGPRWLDIIDVEEVQRRRIKWGEYHRKAPGELSEWLEGGSVEASVKRGVACGAYLADQCPRPICPACGNRLPEPLEDFIDLVNQWFERVPVELECSTCLARAPLQDWDCQPGWAFAQSSLEFEGWSPISADAINRMSAALGGIRIRRVEGHF